MTGKHPANLCPNNKEGKASCHNCGGSCGKGGHAAASGASEELVKSITAKVIKELGL